MSVPVRNSTRRDRPFQAISAVATPRARQRKVDQSAVTRTALAIVERDGLGGLTMRRVADELGVGLATLYGTVGSKDAILDDMIEEVFSGLHVTDCAPGRERAGLIELWTATHECLIDNPAVAQLTALKPAGGPSLFGLIESTLARLRSAGVDEPLLTVAFETIRSYTIGFTLLRISRSNPAASAAEKRLAALASLTSEQFPEITTLATTMAQSMTSEDFVLGLSHLLEGFLPAASQVLPT